jgi:hypothetical protein
LGGGKGEEEEEEYRISWILSVNLHCTMRRQLTTLFAKMGNLVGAQMLHGNCYNR